MANPIVSNDSNRIKKSKNSDNSKRIRKLYEKIAFLEHQKDAVIFDLKAVLNMSGGMYVKQLLVDIDQSPDITVAQLFEQLQLKKLIDSHIELIKISSELKEFIKSLTEVKSSEEEGK